MSAHPLVERLLQGLPPALREAVGDHEWLEAVLAGGLAEGRTEWPGIPLAPEAFVEDLAGGWAEGLDFSVTPCRFRQGEAAGGVGKVERSERSMA